MQPPLGYDDETVIPLERIKKVLFTLEKKLQTLLLQSAPLEKDPSLEMLFQTLQDSIEELNMQPRLEELLEACLACRKSLSKEGLNRLFLEVQNVLSSFLVTA